MVVQHNMQAANANRMLGLTVDSLSKSTEKLSSGYRINRAADDAAGLSISEKMRKQIRGLTQASTNAQDGISCVQTAEGALTEVHSMLQRMNELAVQSANGTNSTTDRNAIQAEIDQLTTEINRVSETTKFNETYLLKGGDGKAEIAYKYVGKQAKITDAAGQENFDLYDACGTKLGVEAVKDAIKNGDTLYSTAGDRTVADSAMFDDSTYSVLTMDLYDRWGHKALTEGTLLVVSDYSDAIASGDYYSDADGLDPSVAPITDMTSVASAATALMSESRLYNADGTLAPASVQSGVALDSDATAVIASSKYFNEVTVGDVAKKDTDYKIVEPYLYDKDGNKVAANGLNTYFEENEDGQRVYKGGLYDSNGKAIGQKGTTLEGPGNEELASFISSESSGKKTLTLNLHVGADATDNNKISIDISAMSGDVLGIKDLKVDTEETATDAISTIAAALQKVSTQRSALGAIQNRLEHTISNLDNVVENTTASESRIRDVDMAEEMVQYSKNNILQQAGQSMLAQANQANQGVLSLLQ